MNDLTDIPLAVKNIRLCQAFKGYNPGILDCIETTCAEEVMLVDDGFTKITTNFSDKNRCCLVENPNGKELVVLPIDHRLIKQRDGGMADGAVFDTSGFRFIEFKSNAEGKTDAVVEATYDDAIGQLKAALNLFSTNINAVGIKFLDVVDVVCHVIVSETFPRAKATEQSKMIEFAMDNNVELSFERNIIF